MIRGAGYTDIGRKRPDNEDDFLVLAEKQLFAVLDGVGGQKDGAKASHMAAECIRRFAECIPPENAADERALKDYFSEVLSNVNRFIYDAAQSHTGNNGMATTLVLVYFAWENCYVINLGDSRAYLVRNGVLSQITKDHTYVNQLIEAGTITPDEALNHPNRNMITRALGAEKNVLPDFFVFPVKPGDRIILCSDGMYNEVPPEEIKRLSGNLRDPLALARSLVMKANEAGGSDNITAVTVFVE